MNRVQERRLDAPVHRRLAQAGRGLSPRGKKRPHSRDKAKRKVRVRSETEWSETERTGTELESDARTARTWDLQVDAVLVDEDLLREAGPPN